MFRNCHSNFERNFKLKGLSTAHAKKDMKETFKEIQIYLKNEDVNEGKPNRQTKFHVGDLIPKGTALISDDAAAKQLEAMAKLQATSSVGLEGGASANAEMGGDQTATNGETIGDLEEEGYWEQWGSLTAEDLSTEGIL